MLLVTPGDVYFISDEPLTAVEILVGFAALIALVFIVEKLTRKK